MVSLVKTINHEDEMLYICKYLALKWSFKTCLDRLEAEYTSRIETNPPPPNPNFFQNAFLELTFCLDGEFKTFWWVLRRFLELERKWKWKWKH